MYPEQSRRLAHRERALRLAETLPADAALSHETGAIASGLPTYDVPAAVQVTRTHGRPVRTSDVTVYVAGLRASDRTSTPEGCPVTSLARTAVDIARRRPFLHALMVADAALARGLERGRLQDVLLHQWNWPFIANAMPVVREADGRSESPLESYLRGRFIALELPRPQLQVRWPEDAPVARVDFYWEKFNLIGEADGRIKYAESDVDEDDALWREKQREETLRDLGAEVIRWRWRQAYAEDEVFTSRLAKAMRRGTAAARLDTLIAAGLFGTNLINFPGLGPTA
jgi:very-short-patch-repair endonuclease